jgi:hypothetical protein
MSLWGERAGNTIGNLLGGELILGLFAGGDVGRHDDHAVGQVEDSHEAGPVFAAQQPVDQGDQGDLVKRFLDFAHHKVFSRHGGAAQAVGFAEGADHGAGADARARRLCPAADEEIIQSR